MNRRGKAPAQRRGGTSGARGRRGAGGQGLTEYLIILALIVIAAIGVYSFFGQSAVPQPPAGAAQKQPAVAEREAAGPGEVAAVPAVPLVVPAPGEATSPVPSAVPARTPAASAPEPGAPLAADGVSQTATSK